jgi:hypothetical protein
VREPSESNHDVALVHLGRTPLAAEGCVAEFIGERSLFAGMRSQLAGWSPDVVVDFILGSAAQAGVTQDVFRGAARRVVGISSGDVYRAMAVLQPDRRRPRLVRPHRNSPARAGPEASRPPV